MQALVRLQNIVVAAPALLRAIPPNEAAQQPAPDKWSRKQELGHLLDSACNNHQRIVRAQLEENPALPSYDGDRWVALHRYQDTEWGAIIDHWRFANEHLIRAASAISPQTAGRQLTIGGGEPITLEFLISDYVDHLMHHLQHIGIAIGNPGDAT